MPKQTSKKQRDVKHAYNVYDSHNGTLLMSTEAYTTRDAKHQATRIFPHQSFTIEDRGVINT